MTFRYKNPLIFFVYPDPKGSEENQFTPPGAGVNKLIFKRLCFMITYTQIKQYISGSDIWNQNL
ncbi:MAG: hypothetical protein A2X05_09900 [Bacteroidetes bacterium GWE2_41_25]|nr:MAG: hypothetical protein A2X06_01060 [Bacteroidetes bacterium GWC2_40_22]OFY07602.1 MAG: hypothetical protein A2X05_09900 [Bacteroidetes bacterium GWE2_41_25]OFY56880.1 MAG: hypothetical protein A2X04_03855 [Bacteroidetes bacterium GWF2_41_9]HBH84814.1 hypothetical protein [Bacteroidales bacterium]HBQ82070.1 hypothetical protein [Bacteroidales bacterium]